MVNLKSFVQHVTRHCEEGKSPTKQSETVRFRPEHSEGSPSIIRSLVVTLLGTILRIGLLRHYVPRNDKLPVKNLHTQLQLSLVCCLVLYFKLSN